MLDDQKTFYAIRDKRVDGYLPQMPTGRGMTHREAIPTSTLKVVPRLFKTELGAKRALDAWLQGAWTRKLSYTWDGAEDDRLNIEPRNRKRENMEIVEVIVP